MAGDAILYTCVDLGMGSGIGCVAYIIAPVDALALAVGSTVTPEAVALAVGSEAISSAFSL